jgi:hypothetical protein
MRQALSVILTFAMLPHFASAAPPTIAEQVAAIPQGTRIELRMKTKEKFRGAKGVVADTGFTLVSAGTADRQIAFNDVASVKQYKSHTTRNVLIIVGIGVVATVGIIAAVALRCGPLGCNSKL